MSQLLIRNKKKSLSFCCIFAINIIFIGEVTTALAAVSCPNNVTVDFSLECTTLEKLAHDPRDYCQQLLTLKCEEFGDDCAYDTSSYGFGGVGQTVPNTNPKQCKSNCTGHCESDSAAEILDLL